jgi:hypothetical protein
MILEDWYIGAMSALGMDVWVQSKGTGRGSGDQQTKTG